MARPLRIEYPGALYHITSRGNTKQPIYLDENDRVSFLDTLSDVIGTHNWLCHAYCLMGNHYHLLVETPDGNLSQGMRDLNGNYSQKFNKKHERVGHLFQGRYKAFVIEKETYLLEVARYTVVNAVRAGLVNHPNEWCWSSYTATVGTEECPEWLCVNWILGFFSSNKREAQEQYREFVERGIGEDSPFIEVKEGVVLGSPQFFSYLQGLTTRETELIKEIPRSERIVGRPSLEDLFGEIKDSEERDRMIVFAKKRCGYLNTEIGKIIQLDHSTVSKIASGTYKNKKSNIKT
ncbi:MAG: transposase [Candidatus Uhrbacteria bacterium]